MSKVVIRDMRPSDFNFVYATMLRNLHYSVEYFSQIDKDAFFFHYQQVVQHLLTKTNANNKVACLAADDDVILGYALQEPGILHYVYIKEPWRKQGIGKMLVAGDIELVTHITKSGNAIRKKKNWALNPWKL